jgi:vacuolar protein sorting-associated protein 35
MVGELEKSTCLDFENYDALASKCVQHSNRLLKKQDQSRGLYICSHLWWNKEFKGSEKTNYSTKTLELLQKSLKMADKVLDSIVSFELFIEILDRYIWFYNRSDQLVMFYFIFS